MILVVDIGNYKIALALFEEMGPPVSVLSLPRHSRGEASEAALIEHALEAMEPSGKVRGAAMASVVPDLTPGYARALQEAFGNVVVLDHETPVDLPIRYFPPSDLGPDRIANALALVHTYGGPACAVDLGTATTFDVVSAEGEFAGGAIAPGIVTGARSLYEQTARLKQPAWRIPDSALGRSTEECLLSGTVLGYAGLVDHLVSCLEAETAPFAAVVATGSRAEIVAQACRRITVVNPTLTLEGINIAYHQATARM